MKNNNKINWIIHMVANGVMCDECNKEEDSFISDIVCNAHTHGMELYNHQDFQLVLNYPPNIIGYILNTLGLRVQAGERFKAGDMVSGIFEDCDVRLDEFEETGRTVLRVIVPDKHNRFPEDEECMEVYRYQLLETDALSRTKEGVQ